MEEDCRRQALISQHSKIDTFSFVTNISDVSSLVASSFLEHRWNVLNYFMNKQLNYENFISFSYFGYSNKFYLF